MYNHPWLLDPGVQGMFHVWATYTCSCGGVTAVAWGAEVFAQPAVGGLQLWHKGQGIHLVDCDDALTAVYLPVVAG